MSFNYEQDLELIESFVGKECERTLACNTLKIRFGDKSPYIWIDPPWRFFQEEKLVTASIDFPQEGNEVKRWFKLLDPINNTTFESYKYTIKGGLWLYFQNGFSIHAPTTIEVVDETDFYNHWYASC